MEPKLNHDMEEKYVVYKRATSTVIRWLLNHSKHTCELTDESIKMMDLISLAQGVKASSVTAWVLSRLRTAIRLRREVARYFQATAADVEDAVRKESNLSHDVMVQILERALHSLYSLQNIPTYDKEAHPAFDRALPIPFTRFCVVKLWCKCAGILGRVYSKYEPLVKQDLEAGNIKLSVHEQEFRRLFHSAGELKGGQKCASVVEKTLAVLELPKKSKQRLKMPPSQQKLPEIRAEALKSIDDWKAEDFLWRSMGS
ncbi:MAG: hypothetical protein Q9162_000358 [Coniocarpon cinnabarinum]